MTTIHSLTSLPQDLIDSYISTIAKWHFNEWGKYKTEVSLTDWVANLHQSLKKGTKIFVAVDKKMTLLGSVSLKQSNMENKFPDFFPWLSGLYIDEPYRGKDVSKKLLQRLAQELIDTNTPAIYVFSHQLDMASYYMRFGFEEVRSSDGKKFYYKNAPIVILKSDSKVLHDRVNNEK